jgi:hypothetical protein
MGGAEWDSQMCTECQFSGSRLQLCALLEEASVSRVANVLVDVTTNTNNIESEDVSIVSDLLDQVVDSGVAEDAEVTNDFFSTLDNLFEVDETALMSSNEESGSVNRITEAFDNVVDQIALTENTANDTTPVVFEFRNFVVQVLQPPQDNKPFTPDISSLVMAASRMSGENTTDSEVVTGNVTLPAVLSSSGESLAIAAILRSTLYPTGSSNTSVGSIILSVSFPNRTVANLSEPVNFVFEKNEVRFF